MSAPQNWYAIRNATDAEVEVSIYDEIGAFGVSAKSFLADLKAHAGKRLNLRINSPGGSIVEGNAIFNGLKRHKGGVTVQVDALAASMATYIATLGAPVRMAENGLFMIHNPSVSYTGGESKDLRRMADLMDKMKGTIVAAYVQKTGKEEAEIEQLMDAETWFTADEAKDFGFVDEVTDRVEAKNNHDLSRFRNAPAVDLSHLGIMANKTIAEAQAIADDLQNKLTAAEASVAQHKADAEAANSKLEAANQATAAVQAKLDGEVTAHAETKNKLTASEGEVATLKASAKNTQDKAAELLAAKNIAPAAKEEPGKISNGSEDGKALYEKYNGLMQSDPRAASEFWAQNEKALMDYAGK